jgi:endonuclease/exonuclease/phosphatase family metal-dependent hydrolase
MKIASFNINNINRRLTNLLNWLHEAEPDIVCLQETKAAGPAEGGEADAPEKHEGHHRLPFSFLQETCALSRSTASNKLLRSKSARQTRRAIDVLEAHDSERRDVITGRGAIATARKKLIDALCDRHVLSPANCFALDMCRTLGRSERASSPSNFKPRHYHSFVGCPRRP